MHLYRLGELNLVLLIRVLINEILLRVSFRKNEKGGRNSTNRIFGGGTECLTSASLISQNLDLQRPILFLKT